MHALDVEEMESSSNIKLKDVSGGNPSNMLVDLGANNCQTFKRRVHIFNYRRKAILHCT